MEEDGLSNEQTEQVLQFQDLTGIDDINVCRDILIRHDWNLEIAYQERERMNEGVPSLYASSPETRAPVVVNDRYLQHIFLNHNRTALNTNVPGSPAGGTGGIIRMVGYFVNYIVNLCYNTMSSVLQTLVSIFADRERIVTDPLGDVLKFIQDYSVKYPTHPVFYQGTYAQALNDAKRELKFLLIYLHSETSPIMSNTNSQRVTETVNFCRNTLANQEVIEYINRNMLFWASDVSSPEGYRVSHSINARSHPILVLIALRDNKMTIMGRMEGDCSPEELLTRMRKVVSDNERWLNAARHDRLERSLTQTLRQQQDVAYEESLKADQEKERRRQLEREEQQKIENEKLEELLTEERRRDLKERVKMEMATQLPSEPLEVATNAISIVFKLPNGMRIERRFLTTNSLSDIHNFIFCHPDAPDIFEITQNFPKRILNCGKIILDGFTGHETVESVIEAAKENIQSVAEAGLANREVLFVSDLDA